VIQVQKRAKENKQASKTILLVYYWADIRISLLVIVLLRLKRQIYELYKTKSTQIINIANTNSYNKNAITEQKN